MLTELILSHYQLPNKTQSTKHFPTTALRIVAIAKTLYSLFIILIRSYVKDVNTQDKESNVL